MNEEKFFIPRYLDDAPKFLFWSIDDAMIFIIPIFFGIMVNTTLIFMILSLIFCRFWKKLKGVGGRGVARAIIYWYYPKSMLDLKYTPDSAVKNYIS